MKLIKPYIIKIVNLIIISCILIFPFSCSSGAVKDSKISLTMAVLSNTFPDSPFSGYPEILQKAVEDINTENPLLVIHAGNLVHGGEEWMGIKPMDMERQFRKFSQIVSGLNSLLFTVEGDKDLYNGSDEYYRKYTGRPAYYSFNYGATHFIVLKTSLKLPGLLDAEQESWLKKDLGLYRSAGAIIVIAHHPVYVFEKGGKAVPRAAGLHDLFSGYPVRLCLSAAEGDSGRGKAGNIEYISAGCGGYNEESRLKNDRHFYVIDYDGNTAKVTEKISAK